MSEERLTEHELLQKISNEIDRRASLRRRVVKWLVISLAGAVLLFAALVVAGSVIGPPDYARDKREAFDTCMAANTPPKNDLSKNLLTKQCDFEASCQEKDEFLRNHPEWRQYAAPGCD